jgi:recombination DNA repair RAD52 pathway protein
MANNLERNAPQKQSEVLLSNGLTEGQAKVLMSRLNPQRVKSRSQGGRSLSYLESYDVRATLIRVFGFGGFNARIIKSEIIDIREVGTSQGGKMKFEVSAAVTMELYIKQLDATYTETAASSQIGSQGIGDIADFSLKTAASDALKRCAINLGTQFGLSLYNNGSTSEIVQTIFAPGQQFFRGQYLEPTVDAYQEAPAPEGSEDGVGRVTRAEVQEVERHPGVTDEQHQQNLDLLEQAKRMAAKTLDAEEATENENK